MTLEQASFAVQPTTLYASGPAHCLHSPAALLKLRGRGTWACWGPACPCLSLALPGPAPSGKGQAQGHMRSSRAVFHPVPRLFVQHAVQISLSQNMESGTALPGSMSKPFQVLEKVTPLQSSDLPDSITPQKCLDENCSKQSQRKASTSPLV